MTDNDVLDPGLRGWGRFFMWWCWNNRPASFSVGSAARRTEKSTPRDRTSLRPCWIACLSTIQS